MEKTEYIKKYLKEAPSNLDSDSVIFVSENGLYVGLKGLSDVDESIIDILAEYEICELHSTFKPDKMHTYPVANYGFSEKQQKWYGWSHRALYGFEIGSEIKKGYCGYLAPDRAGYEEQMMEFWSDPAHIDMKIINRTDKTFTISWTYASDIPYEALRGTPGSTVCRYPDEFGKGEWVAKTLEDAKQMAVDFAESVS